MFSDSEFRTRSIEPTHPEPFRLRDNPGKCLLFAANTAAVVGADFLRRTPPTWHINIPGHWPEISLINALVNALGAPETTGFLLTAYEGATAFSLAVLLLAFGISKMSSRRPSSQYNKSK